MQMTAVTETPAAPDAGAAPTPEEAALEKVTQWANDYLATLTEKTHERLAQIAAPKAAPSANGRFKPAIGEPAVGPYVGFDVATTSPIQITGFPPYQPSKVIAAGELAFLVAFMFINPMPTPFPPPTTMSSTKLVQSGTFGAPAPSLSFAIFALPTPDPGLDAAVYEANVTFDITDPGQPYAAFATNFFDVDADPGFLFVPPSVPQWRHDTPNRYLVYRQ
jgi:hypothetical protein